MKILGEDIGEIAPDASVGAMSQIRYSPESPDVKSGSPQLFYSGVGYSMGSGADGILHIYDGSVWHGNVPCVNGLGDNRKLNLYSVAYDWNGNCRVLRRAD